MILFEKAPLRNGRWLVVLKDGENGRWVIVLEDWGEQPFGSLFCRDEFCGKRPRCVIWMSEEIGREWPFISQFRRDEFCGKTAVLCGLDE